MFELGAPSEHVRSGHRTKLIGQSQIDKLSKAFQVILIGTACPGIVQLELVTIIGGVFSQFREMCIWTVS
jgi:hypothetical protein